MKQSSRTRALIVVALVIIIAVAWWWFYARQDQVGSTVKVGALLPMSGRLADFGKPQQLALELAENWINENGGVGGRAIEFVVEDSQGDATAAVSGLRKLLAVDQVEVVFAFQSSIIQAIQPIIDDEEVVLMAFAMDPQVGERSEFTYRIYPNMKQQSQVMLEYLRGGTPRRVGLLYIDTPATQFVVPEILVPGIAEAGSEVVVSVSFTREDRDLKTHIARLGEANPDTLVTLAHFVFIPSIFKSLAEQGLLESVEVLGDLSYTFPLEVSSDMLEGVRFVAPSYALESDAGSETTWFEQSFKERTGSYPGYDPAFFFDAALIVATGLEDSPEDLKRFLDAVRGYAGESGSISINGNGDADVDMEVGVFSGGRMVRLPAELREAA